MRSFLVYTSALAFFILILTGCEKSKFGTVDVSTDIPSITHVVLTPDSIFIDNLTPQNGRYTISAVVSVKASSAEGNLSVSATVLRPGGSALAAQFTLRDDGVSPDQTARDSVYTARVEFTIGREQAGRYRVRLQATSASGNVSNALERALKLGRRNSAPVLLSVSIPDSITVPVSDTIKVQFTATVSDSDGLGDIREVTFRRISPPDPTRFFMKDDGSLDPPVSVGGIPVRSGDDVAGDGRYSFLIPITPTATRRTNVFLFQAVDSFGDTSHAIIDSLIVR